MRIYLLITYIFFYSTSSFAEIKDFKIESFSDIEDYYDGEKFLVMLWSVDCPPCIQELTILKELNQKNNLSNIVLINVDGKAENENVQDIITMYSLENLDNWIFADSYMEKLRYKIDQNWAGELPRSYYYEPNVERLTITGMIPKDIFFEMTDTKPKAESLQQTP